MNRNLYKVIFSKSLSVWVVVGETTKQAGKQSSNGSNTSVLAGFMGRVRLSVLSTLLALGAGPAWSLEAGALPGSVSVTHGSVNHSVAGNTMTVTQSTAKAVVNYQSFNIGRDATVNHSGGTMLARVTGTDSTQIDGRLNTSGMVLVNPHGIAIGKTGNVNAGSFTASTFDIKDEDFLRGEYRFERGTSQARVVNEGKIEVTQGGGYVALIGASVDNHGRIQTQGTPVVMAAGHSATIRVPLAGKVSLELDAADLNVSVTNHQQGVIVTEGGQVMMRAAAVVDAVSGRAPAQVKQAGLVDTTGQRGGKVEVLADKGTVRASGVVKANSTNGSAGGDIYIGRDVKTNVLAAVGDASGAQLESQGGFVETSGDYLVTTGTRVKAKEWLLDPYNIEIVDSGSTTPSINDPLPSYKPEQASSTILNSDIVANLNNGTNVTITTASNTGTEAGNITVNADIIKTTAGDASLTLLADNAITINKKISAEVDAFALNVTLRAGITPGTGRISIAATGGIDAGAGEVTLQTQGDRISTAAGSTIRGGNISMNNHGGQVSSGGNFVDAVDINQIVNGIEIGGNITAIGNINIRGNLKDPGVGINILNTASISNNDIDGGWQINIDSNQNLVQSGAISATFITMSGHSVVVRNNVTAASGWPGFDGSISITAHTGGITREASGLLTGHQLLLNVPNGEIGTALEPLQTKTTILYLASAGNQYVNNDGDMLLDAVTLNSDVLITSTGNIILFGNGVSTGGNGASAGTGNIVLAAGAQRSAGDGSGGSIQSQLSGTHLGLNTTGTVRLFTGDSIDTSLLSALDPSFAELYLSPILGEPPINAQANVAYQPNLSISNPLGPQARAQVFFRKPLSLDPSIQIDGLYTGYGDLRAGDSVDGLLRDANANRVFTLDPSYHNAGIFKFSSTDFFNQVSAQIVNATYSSGGDHLNANNYAVHFTPLAGGSFNPVFSPNNGEPSIEIGTFLNVQPKFLSVGFEAQDKIFDGDTLAVVQPLATGNQLPGDLLDISYTSANFADAEIGNDKDVNITGILVGGANAGNYVHLNTTAVARASILPFITDRTGDTIDVPFDPPGGTDPGPSTPDIAPDIRPEITPPVIALPTSPEPEKPIPSVSPNLPVISRAIEQVELKPAEEDRNTCGRETSYSCQCDTTEYVLSNSMQRFEACQPRNLTKRVTVTWN